MVILKNSAKAIIIINDHILLIKKAYDDGSIIYTLPGGTQEAGETLVDALVREVKEETDASVEVLDLVHVYEHRRASRKQENVINHKVEFAFVCRLTEPYQPHNGAVADSHQVAVEWIAFDQLNAVNLNPPVLVNFLPQLVLSTHRIYIQSHGA